MPPATIPIPSLTPELLSSIAGILLSLLASYLPGFSAWFERLQGIHKRLALAGALLLSAIGFAALSCSPWGEAIHLAQACDQSFLLSVIWNFILAFIANQSTYVATRK